MTLNEIETMKWRAKVDEMFAQLEKDTAEFHRIRDLNKAMKTLTGHNE